MSGGAGRASLDATTSSPALQEVDNPANETPRTPSPNNEFSRTSSPDPDAFERRRKAGACFNCGGVGHKSRECKERPSGDPIKCAKCGKKGHKAAVCRAGGKGSLKELQVGLQDAISKEEGVKVALEELKRENAELKADNKAKQLREEHDLSIRDAQYVDRVLEDILDGGIKFQDKIYVRPHSAVVASVSVGATLFLTRSAMDGILTEAGLWGLPSGALGAGLVLLGEYLRPKRISPQVIRGAACFSAACVWVGAAVRRGVLAQAAVAAIGSMAVSAATYVALRALPYYSMTAEVTALEAEETNPHDEPGNQHDLPKDLRPDSNNALKMTHANPGFARCDFTPRYFGFTMASWRKSKLVSLEKFCQVTCPSVQEVDETDASIWRRVKAACRTIHRVNDDRYAALSGELISLHTAHLCYTALRDAKLDCSHFQWAQDLIEGGDPKE